MPREATTADYVRRLVDSAPPLTGEQRTRLSLLLTPATAVATAVARRAA